MAACIGPRREEHERSNSQLNNAFPLIDPMPPTTLRGDDMSGATFN
jgi:hypothetical protein